MKFNIYLWFELLALLSGIFSIRRLKESYMILFVPYLALVFCVEFYASYIVYVLHQPSIWIYNIFNFAELSFWILFFISRVSNIVSRKLLIFLQVSFLVLATINYFFFQGPVNLNTYSFIYSNIILLIATCCYFYDLLKRTPEGLLLKNSTFWIASGSLLYNCGSLIYFSLYNYLLVYLDMSYTLMKMINWNLIAIEYTCISIGLFLYKPKINSIKT